MNTAQSISTDIRFVAIYLRKSRGDEQTALDKHRAELVKMCEDNNWRYVEFAEVESGDSIAGRPKMQELLSEVKKGSFDAVLVVDYDRLGRGDKRDQALIESTFAESGTFIITPQKVFDLNNESDMMLADFQGMLARMEYKQIRKRMMQGKKRAALMGRWTSSRPPIPYEIDPETKRLVINEEKLPVYRMIVEKCLEGYTTEEIAWELNKQGIPSPTGKMWSATTIYNTLLNEVHLGHIVINKKVKTSDGFREQSRDKWTVVKNCHKPVKTEREHQAIKILLNRTRNTPHAARKGNNILSGLLRCGLCGGAMYTLKRKNRANDSIKPCYHAIDPFGTRCSNRGGQLSFVMNKIKEEVLKMRDVIIERIKEGNVGEKAEQYVVIIQSKLDEIKKQEKAIERIDEAYEEGIYSKDKYHQRMSKAEEKLRKLEEEYEMLKNEYDAITNTKDEDRLHRLNELLDSLDIPNLTNSDLNKILKLCISEIVWIREDEESEPEININFL